MRLLISTVLLLLSFTGFSQQYYLFVGTYTEGPAAAGSKGIYVYTFDAATGEAKPVSTAASTNPSYLTVAPGGKYVYAVGETDGATPGSVSAFSFDKKTGQLSFINKQESGGGGPCYVTVDAQRKWAMVANYGGGSFSALPIAADGSLKPATETIQHTGGSGVGKGQDKPHVHSTTLSPDEKYLVVCDLGTDKLSLLKFNAASTKTPLTNAADSVIALQPGVGPRHSAFVPGKPFAYVIEELTGTVDAFSFKGGKLTPIQHISSLPEGFKGDIGSADIHISSNGKFLYASNRGDANSIVTYAIDQTTGKLTVKGFQSTMGKQPRNFMIDPTGHWLLAANQGGKNVVIFKIDQQTGLLTATGKQLEIPAPVCLKMTPLK